MNRHKIRTRALQAIYQLLDKDEKHFEQADIRQAIANATYLDDEELDDVPEYLNTLVGGVLENEEAIDETISEHLDNWQLNQLNRIDSNILRLATFEINYVDDTPNAVAIDEAIELAKAFSDESAQSFINGVLSSIANNPK